MTKLTKGEQRALADIYAALEVATQRGKWACQPNRVQYRTMVNLENKGLLAYESGPYGQERWRLTDKGEDVGKELAKAMSKKAAMP